MKIRLPNTRALFAFLGSNRFWKLILGLFAFQSIWIALTVRYPMAFDEQFHFGIIKVYAQHLSPFWNTHPAGVEQFGAITRDPSYLYQYLLSFPYRLISVFTDSQTIQVIALRCINISIVVGALVVFRRVLQQLGASAALRNTVLAFFALTPVVPFLAAQINYDSLLVLMTGLSLQAFLSFRRMLRSKYVWNWTLFAQLALYCVFASLVKYAFLPLAFGIVMAVVAEGRFARKLHIAVFTLPKQFKLLTLGLYGLLLVLGVGLFSERYAVNLVRYHTPIPECNQVLSINECMGYAPWARNYRFAAENIQVSTEQILTYPFVWIHRALGETVFTITSRFNVNGTVDYYGATQLPIPNILSWIVFVGGGLLAIGNWRQLRARSGFGTVLGISAIYVIALFVQNLLDYINLGYPVAIHGRYLLPILPLLYMAIAYSVRDVITRISTHEQIAARRQTWFAVLVLIVFALEGGGFVTLIMRSHDDWFWPQSRAAQQANSYAQNVLRYVVVDPKLN